MAKAGPKPVFTLLVEVGRAEGDGGPVAAPVRPRLCYAAGVDEAEAVRETVAVLKQADLSPLEVTGQGSLEEREASGEAIHPEQRALMHRALEENAVIVALVEPFDD